jgi:hypothetical protein
MNDLGFAAVDAVGGALLSSWDTASVTALEEPQKAHVCMLIDRMGDESFTVSGFLELGQD